MNSAGVLLEQTAAHIDGALQAVSALLGFGYRL